MTASFRIALVGAFAVLAACEGEPVPDLANLNSTNETTAAKTDEAPAKRAAEPGYGEIAFTTYRGGGERIVFINDRKVKKTWRNMVGRAVKGTYRKEGREVVIAWDPNAKNHGSVEERYRQLGPCSIAYYHRIDKKGVAHDDFSVVLEQSKPRCRTVRVR